MASQKIGRYEIKRELGRGGMATVLHAYDPNFERDVAIKVLPAAFLHDPQFRLRFEREAKMIASLEHPAIVPVYDFGEENGQPYIVMRYMAGGSLAEHLKEGALSAEETARIITRLAPALDAAHGRGIIHRDLKPGNVLFDQYGNAFLSDFGIARLSQQEGATLTGSAIVGTPAYMSPEQVQGEKNIDGRSDIYALGVLIYQMLTGQAPYQADTPAKVMLMHLLEPVPDIRAIKSDLPAGCEQVIQRAMAKNPEDRYSSVGELAAHLEAIVQAPTPVQVKRIPLEEETRVAAASIATQPAAHPAMVEMPAESAATVMANIPSAEAALPVAARAPLAVAAPVTAHRGTKVAPRKMNWRVIAALVGLIVLAGAMAGMYFIRQQGKTGGAAVLSASSTPTSIPASQTAATVPATKMPVAAIPIIPSATIAPATATEMPAFTDTPMPSPTQPIASVIGGADKIAFIKDREIWVANLDGSELTQLTQDSTLKSSLQWTPDGEAITYISAKCLQIVHLADRQVETITCFKGIDSFKSFEASPDGKMAALTLDNQLYLVPYDLERLKQADRRSDLTNMAECKDFAPFTRNFVTMVRWSKDASTIAARLIANLGSGVQGDLIQVLKVDKCIPNPRPLDNFPPPRFEIEGYKKNPQIPNFDWDGGAFFALHNNMRNDGFGNLYLYNAEKHKAYANVNPVNGHCCYRDVRWSPDGKYLLFAFQDYMAGAESITQIYYIPYGSIGSEAQYTPLPLPEITDPKEKPQPILRPAK